MPTREYFSARPRSRVERDADNDHRGRAAITTAAQCACSRNTADSQSAVARADACRLALFPPIGLYCHYRAASRGFDARQTLIGFHHGEKAGTKLPDANSRFDYAR